MLCRDSVACTTANILLGCFFNNQNSLRNSAVHWSTTEVSILTIPLMFLTDAF